MVRLHNYLTFVFSGVYFIYTKKSYTNNPQPTSMRKHGNNDAAPPLSEIMPNMMKTWNALAKKLFEDSWG